MTRADRYVLREFAGPFVAGLILSVLLIFALQLQRATGGIVRGGASLIDVAGPLLHDIPRIVVMAMPVATALGTSLAVNRLARDREVTVLRGTGKSLVRCFAPLLAMGLLLTGVIVWISEVGVPMARSRGRSEGAGSGVVLGPGALPDATARRLVSFAEPRGDGRTTTLERVVVADDRGISVAPRARYRDRELVLEAAYEHAYDSEGTTVREVGPRDLRLHATLDFVPQGSWMPSDSVETSFRQLSHRAAAARRQGDRAGAVAAETARWFKVALPTLCGAFALCAAPLALRFSAAGGFAGVLLSVMVVFVAWNTHLFLQAVSLGGWVPPVACAFLTHALLCGTGVALLRALDR